MKWLQWGIGGLAILVFFFLGTLFLLNYIDRRSANSPLAQEASTIMAALEKYRSSQGAYPVLPVPDSLAVDLKKVLAVGGYLPPVTDDLLGPDKQARYVSYDGKSYGLLFHLKEVNGTIAPDGECLIEVKASATGWWNQPPRCPF